MYVVHAAPVQLRFSESPPGKTMLWTHAGGYNLHLFHHPLPLEKCKLDFFAPPLKEGLKGWGF